jgi:hypothetical protein
MVATELQTCVRNNGRSANKLGCAGIGYQQQCLNMKIKTLLDSIAAELDSGVKSPASLLPLAHEAADLADMVGWAPGPIDPTRQFADRTTILLDGLRERYEQTDEKALAALHDALAALHDAVYRHDRDLENSSSDEEDET